MMMGSVIQSNVLKTLSHKIVCIDCTEDTFSLGHLYDPLQMSLPKASDDAIWELAFNTLAASFDETCSSIGGPNTPPYKGSSISQSDEQKYSKCNMRLHDFSIANAQVLSTSKLKYIRKAYGDSAKLSSLSIRGIFENLEYIRFITRSSLEKCHSQNLMSFHRLSRQFQTADGRVKDLVMEVLHEYDKNKVRILRRKDYLDHAKKIQLVWSTCKMQWSRLAHRFLYDYNLEYSISNSKLPKNHGMIHKVLCPTEQSDEILSIHAALRRRLGTRLPSNTRVAVAIRFTRSRAINSPFDSQAFLSTPPTLASNFLELNSFLRQFDQLVSKLPKLSSGVSQTTGNLSSRSHSAKAASSSDSGAGDANLMGTLLSATVIEWLNPISYCAQLCDDILVEVGITSLEYSSSLGGIRTQLSKVKTATQLDTLSYVIETFQPRYALQHSSFISNDRLYVCLEERALAGEVISYSDESPSNVWPLLLIDLLQKIYCADKAGNASLTKEELSRQLSRPLRHHAFVNAHKRYFESNFVNGLNYPIVVYEELKAFPDIVQVVCATGRLLHFAPAFLANLPESSAFRDTYPDVNHLRAATRRCPHPRLSGLCDPSSSSIISQLYCLTNVFIHCPGKPLNVNIHQQQQQEQQQKQRSGVGEAVPNSARTSAPISEKSLLYLVPLNNVCTFELFRHYIWPSPLTSAGKAEASSSGGDGAAAGTPSSVSVSSKFSFLLPDHARAKVHTVEHRSQSIGTLSGAVSTGVSLTSTFSCKYVLMGSECPTSTVIAAAAALSNPSIDISDIDSFPNVPDKSTGNGSQQMQPCIYLLQLVDPLNPVTSDGPVAGFQQPHQVHQQEDELLRCLLVARSPFVPPSSTTKPQQPPAPAKDSGKGAQASHGRANAGGSTSGRGAGVAPPSQSVAVESLDESRDESSSSLAQSSGGGGRTWDATVLSTLCRWRACTREAVGKKHLCAHHEELKQFMDSKDGKQLGYDSSQYLPRKPPLVPASITSNKRDLILIRAASTLLQELWDGKLKLTARGFLKKCALDMNLRLRLQGGLPLYREVVAVRPTSVLSAPRLAGQENRLLGLLAAPTWAAWKNAGAVAEVAEAQSQCSEYLSDILGNEKEASLCLMELMEFRVYPSAEMGLVRKEFKYLREFEENEGTARSASGTGLASGADGGLASGVSTDASGYRSMASALTMELKICDRKQVAFNRRVAEERENRKMQVKKMMRSRALEEAHAKDAGSGFRY